MLKKILIFHDVYEQTLEDFCSFLDSVQDGEDVIIEICSHGGLIFYGSAVVQKIGEAQRRSVHFTARVYGVAASSAADIVLACDRIEMAKTAAIMIHSAINPSGKDDPGIEIANAAQLDVIRRRIPSYTEKDLEEDRWYTADEALTIGLCDSIINDAMSASFTKLVALYGATIPTIQGVDMEEKKIDIEVEKEDEKAEEQIAEDEEKPDIYDLVEALTERFAELERRISALESPQDAPDDAQKGECDDRHEARIKSIQAKINAICAPCERKATKADVVETPEASQKRLKAMYPNLDRYIGKDYIIAD